jgi:hypothetical protein
MDQTLYLPSKHYNMKKFLFVLSAIFIGGSSFGQNKHIMKKEHMSPMMSQRQSFHPTTASGNRVVVLQENFEGVMDALPAAIPNTWMTNMVTDDTDITETPAFKIFDAATANAGGYWPVPEISMTGANKFAAANDDPAPCDCDLSNAWLETPILDFTGLTNMALYFDIFHDQNFGGGDAEVAVSTDGGVTFSVVPVVLNDTTTTLNVDEQFWQSVIIPLYQFDNMSNIQIRFQWSDNGEWASGYAVDNVVVQEMMANDLLANKVVFGNWDNPTVEGGLLDYKQIPLNQVSPIQVTAVIGNGGINEAEAVNVLCSVTQNLVLAEYFGSAGSTILPSLGKDTLVAVSTFTPTELGDIMITATPISDSLVDENPANDMAVNNMEITEFVYGRDNGICQLFYGNSTNYEFANLYDIQTEDQFGAIEVALRFAAGGEGSLIKGLIYEFQGLDAAGAPVLVDTGFETIEYAVTTEDDNIAGESKIITLPILATGGATLEAGKTYLVSVLSNAETDIAVSGFNTWPGSWFHDGTSWGWTYGIPMVRLNSDESLAVGVMENESLNISQMQVVPNPAMDHSQIQIQSSIGGMAAIQISNALGQKIMINDYLTISIGQTLVSLPQGLSNGLYHVSMNFNGRQFTSTFVK